jgi:putative PIN family toxin of toxin-antitoxin system
MRLVLDTTILVAALRSPDGASRQLLLLALEKRYAILASVPLILEYEAVLTRVEQLAASGSSSQQVNALLDSIVAVAVPVHLAFLWRPVLRDPDDDMVLEVAANGRANAIVTFNQKHFPEATNRFGIQVLSPGIALKHVRIS